MNKIYKIGNKTDWEMEEDIIATSKLNSPDIVFIYDVTDDKGNWIEEIYDEVSDLGFPKRDSKENYTLVNGLGIVWWKINVPNIGEGILFQDASPLAIAFKRKDILDSNIEVKFQKINEIS
jgi:hypothetical protein